jgi:hypothetical protein
MDIGGGMVIRTLLLLMIGYTGKQHSLQFLGKEIWKWLFKYSEFVLLIRK